MKTITLSMKTDVDIPLELDNILPELMYDKSVNQIEEMIVYQGNTQNALSEYFDVEVEVDDIDDGDCQLIINNPSKLKYVGSKMNSGRIVVNGDVDLHVGAQMSGGRILVNGNADSYAGREMTGGCLEVMGDVREFCGSSYVGEWRGMSGGNIIVHGSVGKHLADCMIGGYIHVMGDCDLLAAMHMSGGVIEIDSKVNKWLAGQMKKGTIIINGEVEDLLPNFRLKEVICNPLINDEYHFGSYKVFVGDVTSRGKGSIWVKDEND